MNAIFSLRPFSPASFILYVYLTLHNQFPANLAAANTEPAILGSREAFRYGPLSERAVITTMHAGPPRVEQWSLRGSSRAGSREVGSRVRG
jgi:hypothetical protein